MGNRDSGHVSGADGENRSSLALPKPGYRMGIRPEGATGATSPGSLPSGRQIQGRVGDVGAPEGAPFGERKRASPEGTLTASEPASERLGRL